MVSCWAAKLGADFVVTVRVGCWAEKLGALFPLARVPARLGCTLPDLCLVRSIAMDGTDGLMRAQKGMDTGDSIKVPVGEESFGRIRNIIGEPIDEGGSG